MDHTHTYGTTAGYGASSIELDFDRYRDENKKEASRCHRRNERHGSTELNDGSTEFWTKGMGMDMRCSAMQCESLQSSILLSIYRCLYCSTAQRESHGIELYCMVGRSRADLEYTNFSIIHT